MDTLMELDQLKNTWQALEKRLQLDNQLRLDQLRERKLGKMRGSLRPLFWGQIAQILLIGVPCIALVSLLWMSQPEPISAVVAGAILHLYGIVCICSAGVVLSQLRKIDYAQPVLAIQAQLAKTRTYYVRSGMLAGLPWWFLWITILQVLAGLSDVDLAAKAPSLLWIGYGIGAIGLLATFWFHRWARRPERAAFGQCMDNSLTGGSLRKALAQAEEVRRFEQAD